MASNWEKTTFEKSSIEILDGDRGKNYPKKSEFTESGYCLFLNTGNVTKDGFKFSSTEFVSSERDQLLRKGKLQRGDVVLTTRGTVGNVAYYDSSIPFDHIRINSGMVILRSDNTKILPRYLYLFLRSKLFEDQAIALQSGSAQPQLPIRDIKRVEIKVPPVTEQKAIAHILGSLDDKIELNRQMNETLEAMAQALFKSWFVDFDPVIDNALAAGNAIPDDFAERAEQRKTIERKDNADIQGLFPDEFELTEEMGWIPKGWEVKRIKDIGKVVTGKTPPKKIDNAYSENGIPFITPTDIDDLPFVIYTNRYLSEDGVQAVKNSRISAGSICVTCIGSQMGKTTIAPLASVSNQQINSITGCNQFWRNYLFFNLRRRRDEIFLLGSSGSTMPILNKSNFEAFPILCPSEKLLSSLDSNFQSTIDSILENTKQSYTLTKLRDTLLPKLMSGELRIPDDIL